MTDFTEVGLHCAAKNCNQQDFLPFTCDCCNGTFCLSHREYGAHSCTSSGDKDFRALVCPLCKKTVRFTDSQDPNEQWELHRRTSCNPAEYNTRKPPRKRCAAPSCRETLGPANTQRCSRCAQETCLAHRFPDSHGCSSLSATHRRNSAVRGTADTARHAGNAAARPMSLREKAARSRAVASSRDNTARGNAERRRRPIPDSSGSSARGREECPQCGATFRDVGSLVAHVEAFHPEDRRYATSSNTGSNNGGEYCPVCHVRFADVALLVSHVESAHPDGTRAGLATTYSAGAKNCLIS